MLDVFNNGKVVVGVFDFIVNIGVEWDMFFVCDFMLMGCFVYISL